MGRSAFTPAQRKAHSQAIRAAFARRASARQEVMNTAMHTMDVHHPADQLARQITKLKSDVAILESAYVILTGGGHETRSGQ